MQNFHQLVEFDGLWLDMDEVSNYCTGDVCQNPGEIPHKQLHSIYLGHARRSRCSNISVMEHGLVAWALLHLGQPSFRGAIPWYCPAAAAVMSRAGTWPARMSTQTSNLIIL